MSKNKNALLKFVARQAVLNASALSPAQRADLFDGAAYLLPKKEASAARHAAFLLRECERHQASFVHLLFSDVLNTSPSAPSVSSAVNPRPNLKTR